jgi:hypothetical protein
MYTSTLLLYDQYTDNYSLTLKNQLLLPIPDVIQKQAWHDAQQHSHKIACYNAYVNRVCLYTFISWLNERLTEKGLPHGTIYPSAEELYSILEVVNGAAIALSRQRIILIPSDNSDAAVVRIPQEWVDIPSFAGDYYVAVQVDLEASVDECSLQVQGFTTHRQLQQNSQYDPGDRTYILPATELIPNITILDLTLGIQVRGEVPPLPNLSLQSAQSLLKVLADASIYSPRLYSDIPFTQWAALLNNEEWRQQLYRQRTDKCTNQAIVKRHNLRQWLNNNFNEGWQSFNTFFQQTSANLAYSFRQYDVNVSSLNIIGVKLIDLGIELGNQSVVLLLGLMPESENKIAIRVQLHPAKGQTYIPPNIKLSLISPTDVILQASQARMQDNFIQLKRFTCPLGKAFKIQVAIDNFCFNEEFIIESLTSTSL